MSNTEFPTENAPDPAEDAPKPPQGAEVETQTFFFGDAFDD
ncbi:hypothetical protein [Allokutzneria albata]|uniref:Uncharacterized protein n=1 Tax=Allokutzneria albata TaxID=211114 RepID=A0A1G9U2U7_ALLAB|nr:hypothetical protein [Allokutzneria albata]SDM54317.1 hypothetical protein SAMN04489726_2145 [Allokutzneria albata]